MHCRLEDSGRVEAARSARPLPIFLLRRGPPAEYSLFREPSGGGESHGDTKAENAKREPNPLEGRRKATGKPKAPAKKRPGQTSESNQVWLNPASGVDVPVLQPVGRQIIRVAYLRWTWPNSIITVATDGK